MAIYTPGPMVASVSGSVGGTTFSRNRGGQYTRRRAIPTNPSSTFQLNQRAIFAGQSQRFADITDAERESWRSWAVQNPITNALGNKINMTGHQAFVAINSRLDLTGDTLLDAPPIINAPTALESLVLTADIGLGEVELAFTATPLAAGVKLYYTAAIVNSLAITYVRNLLRFVEASAAAEISPFGIEASVVARLGTLIEGQTLHVLCSTFDTATGLLSEPLDSMAVVVST